jgi:hypothetical protein
MNGKIAGAAAALALAVTGVAAPALSVQPTVRFAALIPVKVRGSHFIASERVLVTVLAGKTRLARTVRASTRGGFLVDFGVIPASDRCSGYMSITATGRRGDHAFYKLPQLECPTSP